MTVVDWSEAPPPYGAGPSPRTAAPRTAPPLTVLPLVDPLPVPPHDLRKLGGWSRGDLLAVLGAGVSALSTTRLLFGMLTPLSGPLGFTVTAFALFVACYALLTSFSEDRPAVVDRVATVMLAACSAVAVGALVAVVLDTVLRGRDALSKTNFYLEDMSVTGPLDPLSQGGIKHAIVGSLLIMTVCLLITVPLGVSCAVFLNESSSRLGRLVRTVVDAMTALPSIVAGLFVFAMLILAVGLERSGLAGAIAVSIVMLPIIIRSADVVLRLVPGNLREASAALGAPLWRTVWSVVLPTARPGLVTSVILGVARGIGETAPVLLTTGFTAALNLNLLENPTMSLPLAALDFIKAPQDEMKARGFATAGFLMLVVLVLFAVARMMGGRPVGQMSGRRARRASARSAKDLARFEARALEGAS